MRPVAGALVSFYIGKQLMKVLKIGYISLKRAVVGSPSVAAVGFFVCTHTWFCWCLGWGVLGHCTTGLWKCFMLPTAGLRSFASQVIIV